MKCPLCKVDLNRDKAIVRRVVNGKKIYFTNVPAWLCFNELTCGNVIFDSLELEKIELFENKIRNGEFGKKELFDFNELV